MPTPSSQKPKKKVAARKACTASTASGKPCSRLAVAGTATCAQHASAKATKPAVQPTAKPAARQPKPAAKKPAPRKRPPKPAMPFDIDQHELAAVVSDLHENEGVFGAGNGNPATSAFEDVAAVAGWVGDNLGKVRDAAAEYGLLDPRRFEQFLVDLASALTGITSSIANRVTGDYEEDDFGFDEELTAALVPIAGLLYDYWWRVDVDGLENVPDTGRGLLVSNHAGSGLPFDGAMIKTALYREHQSHRHVRLLVLDWLMGLPWLADLMKKTGQVLACTPNATELLIRDELVAVFPEGVKGMAKPFSQRYNLQRFGRGGFVRVALKTGAPIIPVAVVGSEEIYPKIGNIPLLNKMIGAPFVPMTPFFPFLGLAGLIPLPSKWHIEFCEPIDVSEYPPEAADDRSFVLELSEQIRQTIQDKLRENLLKRSTPFW